MRRFRDAKVHYSGKGRSENKLKRAGREALVGDLTLCHLIKGSHYLVWPGNEAEATHKARESQSRTANNYEARSGSQSC
jgi:hypothetical protein